MHWMGWLVTLALAGIAAVTVFAITVHYLGWSDLTSILTQFAAKYEANKTSNDALAEINRVVKGKVSSVSVRTVRLDLLNADDTRLAEVVIHADEVSSVIAEDDVIWV